MQVTPLVDIEFNELRAVFPMNVRAPFGFTDFLGEYASAGFPRIAYTTIPYSGNDSNAFEGQAGGCEFDSIAKAIYPRSLFVPHTNVLVASYGSGGGLPPPATGPTFLWYDLTIFDTAGGGGAYQNQIQPPGITQIRLTCGIISTTTGGTGGTGGIGTLGEGSTGGTGGPAGSGTTEFSVGTFTAVGVGGNGVGCQGFTALLTPYFPPVTQGYDCFLELQWRAVGANNGAVRWYAVDFVAGSKCRFGYNDLQDENGFPVNEGWVFVDQIKTGGGRADMLTPLTGGVMPVSDGTGSGNAAASTQQNVAPEILEVRLIAGQMRILINAEDTPYQWPHPQYNGDTCEPDWYIDLWQILGQDVIGADFSVHLTKFKVGASTISQDINTGIQIDDYQRNNMTFRVHYAPMLAATSSIAAGVVGSNTGDSIGFSPPGFTATAGLYDISEGQVVRYQLSFQNPSSGAYLTDYYSDFTAVVRAVSLDIPGDTFQLYSTPITLGQKDMPPLPSGLDIYWQFNLDTLSATSSAALTFDNFKGFWSNGIQTGYLDNLGHFAIGIYLGILGGSGGMRTEFTGIANTSFQNEWGGMGRDSVTMMCRDLWAMLDEPCWALPWFDGWNVYYVIYYLATIGTLTQDNIGFMDYVPSDPYYQSRGLSPDDQYFMPVGVSGTPLTRFGSGMKIKDIMLKISSSIGYTLYFDVNGILQFYKFSGSTFSTANIRTFIERPGSNEDKTPALDEIISGSFSSDLSETRNSVTVIGVNAFGPVWTPAVGSQVDNDSIFDNNVANYKGWPSPLVWADNLFASEIFAQQAASSMLAYLRLPGKIPNFKIWLQPDAGIYPGDLINVVYSRSGVGSFTYFVTQTHVSVHNGQMPHVDIAACIVPGLNGY